MQGRSPWLIFDGSSASIQCQNFESPSHDPPLPNGEALGLFLARSHFPLQ